MGNEDYVSPSQLSTAFSKVMRKACAGLNSIWALGVYHTFYTKISPGWRTQFCSQLRILCSQPMLQSLWHQFTAHHQHGRNCSPCWVAYWTFHPHLGESLAGKHQSAPLQPSASRTEQCCALPTESKATEDFGLLSIFQGKSLPIKGSTSADWAAKLPRFPELPGETITKASWEGFPQQPHQRGGGRQSNRLSVSLHTRAMAVANAVAINSLHWENCTLASLALMTRSISLTCLSKGLNTTCKPLESSKLLLTIYF